MFSLSVLPVNAGAQTAYRWAGGSGAWRDPAQWVPAGVPGSIAGDSAEIGSGTAALAAALSEPLAELKVVGEATLALTGGAWTLKVTTGAGLVQVGDDTSGGNVLIDDDDSPGGLVVISAISVHVFPRGMVDANGTGPAGGLAGMSLDGLGPGSGRGSMGHGSSGGHGGVGGSSGGAGEARAGSAYGQLLQPVAPGSGGGSTSVPEQGPGGSGGGRIRLEVAESAVIDGFLRANGRNGTSNNGASSGGGSGGSIWITAARIRGSGSATANGGNSTVCSGAGGRIAIDGYAGALALNLSARAGLSGYPPAKGGAGTIALTPKGEGTSLIIDNLGGPVPGYGPGGLTPLDTFTGKDLLLGDGVFLAPRPSDRIRLSGEFRIPSAATVVVLPWDGQRGGELVVSAGTARIAGKVKVTGHPGGWAADNGPGAGRSAAADGGGGGGAHGGAGGQGISAMGGEPYGAASAPVDLGSSGGTGGVYGRAAGGGHLRLFASGAVELSGLIDASGASNGPWAGGGAGGSVWLVASSVGGGGSIAASGGSGGAGGGGGRIALFTNATSPLPPLLKAGGGAGLADGGAPSNGGAGTVAAPAGDSLISLDFPLDQGEGDGTVSFSGFELPAGASFRVFLDDDEHLGDGEPGINHPDPNEPMRVETASASPVKFAGIELGRQYFWHVVAVEADGGLLAGSGMSSFLACVSPTCPSELPRPDGGVAPPPGAPRFRSEPAQFAFCGKPYQYLPRVEGAGPFAFTLDPDLGTEPPAGLSLTPESGEIAWTPTPSQEGPHRFQLGVSGPFGFAQQRVEVVVVCRDATQLGTGCTCSSMGSGVAWCFFLLAALGLRGRQSRRPCSKLLRVGQSGHHRPDAVDIGVPAAAELPGLRRLGCGVRPSRRGRVG